MNTTRLLTAVLLISLILCGIPGTPIGLAGSSGRWVALATQHVAYPDSVESSAVASCYARLNDVPIDYPSVQAAVDASTQPTDVVKVAGYCAGVTVRNGVTQTVYLSKTLTIQGGYTTTNWTTPDPIANPTVLDAQGLGRVLFVVGTAGHISPTIVGLHVTNGNATQVGGVWEELYGGGVYGVSATMTISNCTLVSNTAYYGGGVYAYHSTAILVANTFLSNTVPYLGGGLLTSGGATTLLANTFAANSADTGGGLYLGSEVATLTANIVTTNTSQHDCGGMMVEVYDGRATLVGNVISSNRSGWNGGGLCFGEAVADSRPQGASIKLAGNVISDNLAQFNGGGAFLSGNGGTPDLSGNIIQGNTALRDGGGVYLDWTSEHTRLGENTIAHNVAQGDGGGLYLGSRDVDVWGNVIQGNRAWEDGGGVYGSARLQGNSILSNTANLSGGGLYGGGVLTGNIILGNRADDSGGALFLDDSTLVNNIVADNQAGGQGGGLYIVGASALLLHTTIAHNVGSGIYVTDDGATFSRVVLSNTVLVSHTVGVTATAGNTVTLQATLWGSGTWSNDVDWGGSGVIVTGTVNVWGLPDFAGPVSGDYHVGPSSAALDAGVAAGVAVDVDGEPRPAGPGYDLGADEFQAALSVSKHAFPDPVTAGDLMTYTLWVTNTGLVTLNTTISDVLPAQVTPTGVLTWATQIAPGGLWSTTVVVRVQLGYAGPLTNVIRVATLEGVTRTYARVVTVITPAYALYLPVILLAWP